MRGKRHLGLSAACFALAVAMSGCGGNGGGADAQSGGDTGAQNGGGPAVTVNAPPVANPGSDQSMILGSGAVSLDGSASSDPEGSALEFAWVFIERPASSTASLSDAIP